MTVRVFLPSKKEPPDAEEDRVAMTEPDSTGELLRAVGFQEESA
jgi:hypothetical protein